MERKKKEKKNRTNSRKKRKKRKREEAAVEKKNHQKEKRQREGIKKSEIASKNWWQLQQERWQTFFLQKLFHFKQLLFQSLLYPMIPHWPTCPTKITPNCPIFLLVSKVPQPSLVLWSNFYSERNTKGNSREKKLNV